METRTGSHDQNIGPQVKNIVSPKACNFLEPHIMSQYQNPLGGSSSQSRTQTQTQPQTENQSAQPQPVLHLRPSDSKSKKKSRNSVRWTDDVVDNEHMNKKKTKICCIFHPQREFGECSSDSSSDLDSSDSSDNEHDHNDSCNHGRRGHQESSRKRDPSPNAYEKQPHYKNLSKVEE